MAGMRLATPEACLAWLGLAAALSIVAMLSSGCTARPNCSGGSGGDDCSDDGPSGVDDDDSASGDDDSASGDDDDFTFGDEPQFVATYDFSLVMLRNVPSGQYGAIHGTMDVSVSTTDVLAELTTDSGAAWAWAGPVEDNATHFFVRGFMTVPGANEQTWVEVNGNFLVNADGTPSSQDNCIVGLGKDDDPNLPDQGIEFAWYGCRQDAGPAALDRSGSYSVNVMVHSDNCTDAWGGVGFSGTWQEFWQFQGRQLVVSRDGYTGYGVISDDGNVFQYTMVEAEAPGRSLAVIGDFTNPNDTTEARALGYCYGSEVIPASVIDMDYP